jgi:hypothetical protein
VSRKSKPRCRERRNTLPKSGAITPCFKCDLYWLSHNAQVASITNEKNAATSFVRIVYEPAFKTSIKNYRAPCWATTGSMTFAQASWHGRWVMHKNVWHSILLTKRLITSLRWRTLGLGHVPFKVAGTIGGVSQNFKCPYAKTLFTTEPTARFFIICGFSSVPVKNRWMLNKTAFAMFL